MCLLTKHKILTKHNLAKRGWGGSTKCYFCDQEEIIDHLFLQCSLVGHIWFWMGECQNLIENWSTTHVMSFAIALPPAQRKTFLTAFSALAWTIWKL